MAKRKGLASFTRTRRRKRKPAPRRNAPLVGNPPPLTDLVEFIIPGFVGYAGTRFLGRVVHSLISRRSPRWAKHAAALSGVAAFSGSWLLLHKIERLKQYHTPATVGAAIAAAQTVAQAYLPKYSWIVSDFQNQAPQLQAPTPADPSETAQLPPVSVEAQIASELEDLDLGTLGSGSGIASEFDDVDDLSEYMN